MEVVASKSRYLGLAPALALLAALVAVLLYLVAVDTDVLHYIGRKALIALLPIVDWTTLNRRGGCIVRNPWYVTPPPSPRQCFACEDLVSVPEVRPDSVTATEIYTHFVDTRVPVVVRAARHQDQGEINNTLASSAHGEQRERHAKLAEVVRAMQDNLAAKVCAFRSNTPWSFDRFLEHTNSMASFYALWENCNDDAKKLMRRFYRRPARVPAAVELTAYSWVSLSRRFAAAAGRPKLLDFAGGTVATWIQVDGRFRIQLERRGCSCSRLEVELAEGDYLIVRIDSWNVSFTPSYIDGDSLAFIPTGYLQ